MISVDSYEFGGFDWKRKRRRQRDLKSYSDGLNKRSNKNTTLETTYKTSVVIQIAESIRFGLGCFSMSRSENDPFNVPFSVDQFRSQRGKVCYKGKQTCISFAFQKKKKYMKITKITLKNPVSTFFATCILPKLCLP